MYLDKMVNKDQNQVEWKEGKKLVYWKFFFRLKIYQGIVQAYLQRVSHDQYVMEIKIINHDDHQLQVQTVNEVKSVWIDSIRVNSLYFS